MALTIVVTTWAPASNEGHQRRTDFIHTLRSWGQNLDAEPPILMHVADDGSGLKGYPQGIPALGKWKPTHSRQERRGVGASLNAGLRAAFQKADVALYAVDDWALTHYLNVQPWITLLESEPSIGMIRLGPPHPWLTGTVTMFPSGWALVLDRHHYAFSFRPCLIHKRFMEAYGAFPEGESSLECERLYNEHFCAATGPDIALALPDPWEHQYGTCFSELRPSG